MKPRYLFFILLVCHFFGSPLSAQSEETIYLFDGETFEGWSAPEMSYWSIEDGAITATSSDENPCKHNQFLAWQGGELGNFELTLKFRIEGGPKANSGIQVRSMVEEDGHVKGYQVDIAHPDAPYLGCVYDEKSPRKLLVPRGSKVEISNEGERDESELEGGAEAALGDYEQGNWAEYHLTFVDETLTVKLNGRTTAILVDGQDSEREMSGILALQLHSGPPMKVQFKDIQLKKLP